MSEYEINWRAVAKLIVLVAWLVVPGLFGHPFFPLDYASQYVEDVGGFVQNNSTWWGLSEQGRVFYVVFPIPWFVGVAAWYEVIFRARRKKLIVNGQVEGVVMLVVGDANYKKGHLYDIACILNKFRHVPWKDFPRPITGRDHPPGVTIYYRRNFFASPLTYHKISTTPRHITYGIHTLWVDGDYRARVRHYRRPVLDYEVLFDDNPYVLEALKMEEFARGHRHTQETIMKDNYRMTVSEPGTAKTLVRSSMMTISEDTKNEYLDMLEPDIRRDYMLSAIEQGGEFNDGATPRRV